jgi:hypothetical protein
MDPNANLQDALWIARALVMPEGGVERSEEETARLGMRLAELVVALDEWILKGGFLPRRWDPTVPKDIILGGSR